ncbi:MAG: glycosyltransferase [Nitrospirae bacterium]|nr:glycosyltransferase [Nitrospirota bacterium]
MEKDIQTSAGNNKINLMALIVSMPVGGVETQLLSILRRLNRDKYDLMICCIKDLGELGGKASEEGIKTVALNLMKSSRFSLKIPFEISKILRQNKVHILWTHQYVANLYGRMASLSVGTPAVISNFHALYDSPKMHRSFFNRLLSLRTDALIAVSQSVASDMKAYDRVKPEKIKVIHNGIDLSLFDIKVSKAECRRKLGLPENDIIVGTVGRLSEEKNHKVMIEALHHMPGNVKGLIVGDGPLSTELKAGAGRFYFTGRMEYNLIPFALKAMDIFCSPSLWEGFGISLVEATAAGLPAVVSDISTHREVLGEAGLFAPAGNAERFNEALKTIIDDAALRGALAGKAKERAKLFSIDNTVKAYEGLFEEILRRKR